MARYFFHVLNGKVILDDVGLELSDLEQVRKEAIRASGQMLSSGEHTWKGLAWQMIVTNFDGDIVFGISFSVDRHGL